MQRNPEWQARLDAGQKQFEHAEDEIPEGVYRMQVSKCLMRERQKDSKLQIAWGFMIVEGALRGMVVMDFSQLESESLVPMRILNERVRKLGWEPPTQKNDYEELAPEIEQAAPVCMGRVKHTPRPDGGKYVNVVVESLIEKHGAKTQGAPKPAAAVATPIEPEIPGGFTKGEPVTIQVDGQQVQGVVDGSSDAGVHVFVESGPGGEPQTYGCKPEEITRVGAVQEPESEEDRQFDDLNTFAEAHDVTLPDRDLTTDEVVAAINAAKLGLEEANLLPAELALLKATGVTFKAKAAKRKKAAKKKRKRRKS